MSRSPFLSVGRKWLTAWTSLALSAVFVATGRLGGGEWISVVTLVLAVTSTASHLDKRLGADPDPEGDPVRTKVPAPKVPR